MALEPIGDIANPTLTDLTATDLTWDTASDWDNAVAETNVEHASNVISMLASVLDDFEYLTDGEDASGQQGWTVNAGYADGDNGNTNFTTFTNGSINLRFDGGVNKGEIYKDLTPGQPDYINIIVGVDGQSSNNPVYQGPGVQSTPAVLAEINTKDQGGADDGDLIINGTTVITGSLGDGVEAEVELSNIDWDAEEFDLIVDGGSEGTFSFFESVSEVDAYLLWTAGPEEGLLDDLTFEYRTATLTTATKSFNANQQPDLANLSYVLDGEAITVEVIGSPGTASEEIVSQSLDGSSSYSLTWSQGHQDFRVRVVFDRTVDAFNNNPTFSAVTLSA